MGKLGSKVVHCFSFFFFFINFFYIYFQILWHWNTCYGLRTLVRADQLSHFLPIFKVDMAGFLHLHKMAPIKNSFSHLQSAQNGGKSSYFNLVQELHITMQLLVQSLYAMPWWKTKATNILCLCSFIVCNRNKKKKNKPWMKPKKKKKTKKELNPLTCQSQIFHIWTLKLDPSL
jgi:hypothetical protein